MIYRPEKLVGIHPDLELIIRKAAERADFFVVEGLRSLERQKVLLARGASQTLKSRHLTGHAVDICPAIQGQLRWDWPLFYPLAEAVKKAATDLRLPIEWGGDWKSFKDGPHWQLPFANYPA